MSKVPSSSQKPFLSFPAVAWGGAWFVVAIGFVTNSFFGFVGSIAIGLIGMSSMNEGPLYLVLYRKARYRWKKWRWGTAYRREFSARMLTPLRGVGPLKGLFKVTDALLQFRTLGNRLIQMPVLLNNRKHTVFIESGSIPAAAMADEGQYDAILEKEAGLYVDLAESLGLHNSLTIWSLHRAPDDTLDAQYASQRISDDFKNPEDEYHAERIRTLDQTQSEVVDASWDRRRGLALTATNPGSWSEKKLDRLTAKQVQESAAVKTALLAEDKMRAIGMADASVCSLPQYRRLIREIMSVKQSKLSIARQRDMMDIVEVELAKKDNELVDPKSTFGDSDTIFPNMQRELGNDYMIFDGTYHRVIWITEYLSRYGFEPLHTARCNYFVGVYADIQLAEKDDSLRQDKVRLVGQLKKLRKRNVTAQDKAELNTLDEERFNALEYGRYVPYFRTLVIVSGADLDDLELNEKVLLDHLARHNVRVKFQTVTGEDQLEWFFATLGSFGS